MPKKTKSKLQSELDKISKAEQQISNSVAEVIKEAESTLKGQVSFVSKQEYDDNNYYTLVSIDSIGDTHFDSFEIEHDLDVSAFIERVSELKKDPKFKIKELLSFEDSGNFSELEGLIFSYCHKKKISLESFFEAFFALCHITHLYNKIPESKMNYE